MAGLFWQGQAHHLWVRRHIGMDGIIDKWYNGCNVIQNNGFMGGLYWII